MTLTFAYECYADEDVMLFLRDRCRLPLRKHHSFGQGEVVNDLLKKAQANIGWWTKIRGVPITLYGIKWKLSIELMIWKYAADRAGT